MLSFPNAKINLGLNILRKREDGYHDIESCFYPIPWCDCLEIIPSTSFSFSSYGLEIPGDHSTNLCVKAFQLIKSEFDISPVDIHLLKSIPMGAGLGGGSADGAFTLKMLNEQFELNLTTKQLQDYALQLGSDCPFFIENQPSIATGRGENLQQTSVSLNGYYLAIHNPNIHISTQNAYAGVVPQTKEKSINSTIDQGVEHWKEQLVNDFESSVFENNPEVAAIKSEMYEAGAIYSSMTGSGSTVYGIFKEKPQHPVWGVSLLP